MQSFLLSGDSEKNLLFTIIGPGRHYFVRMNMYITIVNKKKVFKNTNTRDPKQRAYKKFARVEHEVSIGFEEIMKGLINVKGIVYYLS